MPLADLCHGVACSDLDWHAGSYVIIIRIFIFIFLKDQLHRLKNHLVLLIGLNCVHRQIASQFYSGERVLSVPLLSKVRAACHGRTAAIIIYQPWAQIHWIWIILWGTSGVKYVGTVFLFLSVSLLGKVT